MPIRPKNKPRYLDRWPEISRAVKGEAGWRCECTGECGRRTHDGRRCLNPHGQPAVDTGSEAVITTADLDHTPENCIRKNLRAMCQGCHLHYDKEHHAKTRARTNSPALTGQMEPRFEVGQ